MAMREKYQQLASKAKRVALAGSWRHQNIWQ
jgi:hypothetical protein